MVNKRKLRLMTRLALYEEKEGKNDLQLSKYHKRDYVRMQMISSAIFTTLGYLLVMGMYFVYRMEFLVKNAVRLNYYVMGRNLLIGYVVILGITETFTWLAYSLHYAHSHKKLAKYFRMLRKLRNYYNGTDKMIDYTENDEDESGEIEEE